MKQLEHASIKRVAWAFGCAKKGSQEESDLYRLLVDKVMQSRHADKETSRA